MGNQWFGGPRTAKLKHLSTSHVPAARSAVEKSCWRLFPPSHHLWRHQQNRLVQEFKWKNENNKLLSAKTPQKACGTWRNLLNLPTQNGKGVLRISLSRTASNKKITKHWRSEVTCSILFRFLVFTTNHSPLTYIYIFAMKWWSSRWLFTTSIPLPLSAHNSHRLRNGFEPNGNLFLGKEAATCRRSPLEMPKKKCLDLDGCLTIMIAWPTCKKKHSFYSFYYSTCKKNYIFTIVSSFQCQQVTFLKDYERLGPVTSMGSWKNPEGYPSFPLLRSTWCTPGRFLSVGKMTCWNRRN